MKVYFVGAGPGDPDLITVKGRALLEKADTVIYAGSLVAPEILGYCRKEAHLLDSAGMSLDEVVRVYREAKGREGILVRLHTGDPAVYGAIQEQMDWLREAEIPFEVVPGVSSFQASAAALERQLTLPGVSQTVILTRISGRTKTPEAEDLALLARSQSTMVLFLSADRAAEVQEKLLPVYGGETPIAVVYRASWPDQKILRGCLADLGRLMAEAGISRQALIFVGEVLAGEYEKSRLYDAAFSHGFREGQS